jgi:nucleoporin NDC1
MWAQVYGICMELLKNIDNRVDEFGKPTASAAAADAEPEPQPRASVPLRDDAFLTKQNGQPTLRGGIRNAINHVSQSPGSSPAKKLSPLAKRTWNDAKDHLLTKQQQDFLSPTNVKSQFDSLARYLVSVPWVGRLVYEDFGTRFAGIVLGTPFAEPTLYCNATRSLCHLAVKSLGEDQYGNVHRDVPSIIRTMTSIIRKVEALRLRFPIHWTDTKGIRGSPDVDQVLDTLRDGLSQVVAAFEPFSTDLRLTLGDLRHAREAASKPEPVKTEEERTEERQPEPRRVQQRRPEERRRIEPSQNERRSQRRRLEEQAMPEMEQVATGRARA